MYLRSAFLGLVLLLSGCSGHWLSFFGQDNSLVGRIWDVKGEKFISEHELIGRLGPADYVMLGEKHDNLDHHRLQAQVLRQLYDFGRRPAVAFEMIDFDQGAALQDHLAAAPNDAPKAAKGIGKAVKWERTGWPDWQHYQPLAQAALAAGAPVVAANLPRRLSRAVGKEGYAALDAEFVSSTGLDQPQPEGIRLAVEKEIGVSHCGYLPKQAVPAVARVQRAKDAAMAHSLRRAGAGAVLIAGAGHARTDHGVPLVLRRMAPDALVLSLSFQEVHIGDTDPALYAENYLAKRLPFDYVWFTPRRDIVDPCERFKKQLQKFKKKS
jgi:uncharacterized iron-regulated protein